MPRLQVLEASTGAGASGILNIFFEDFLTVAMARHAGSLREIWMAGRIDTTCVLGWCALMHTLEGEGFTSGPALLQLFESHSNITLIHNSDSDNGNEELVPVPTTSALADSRGRPIRLLCHTHQEAMSTLALEREL